MSFRSYCITVRPRDGITDKTVGDLKKWLDKCSHSVAVLELDEEARHLHAQIWFENPKVRGDICKQIQRVCERTVSDWDNAQTKVLRQGVKIAYSDWYLDYLVENDLKAPPNILVNNPPEKTMDYYPSEQDQQNIIQMNTAVDPRFARLEISYLDWLGDREISLKTVASYLANAMFVDRTIKVILQQRDRKALAISLYGYVSKSTDIYLFMEKDLETKKFEKLISNITICPLGKTELEESDEEDEHLVDV